jgi:hypothetical protein
MSKFTQAVVDNIKARFESGDIPTGADFTAWIQDIADGIEAHEHTAEGGPGSGTGDASAVPVATHGNEKHSSAYITGADVPVNESDPTVDATLKGITLSQIRNHSPQAHNHDDRYFSKSEHIAQSAGAGDAGKPIKLNTSGKVDSSMLDGGGGGFIPNTFILVEAAYSQIGQGPWDPTTEFIQTLNDNNGNNISWQLALPAGTYTLRLVQNIAESYGIIDIDIDGTEVASFDGYVPDYTYVLRQQTGIVIAQTGTKTITLRVDGKNPSSTNYGCSMSNIVLIKTS